MVEAPPKIDCNMVGIASIAKSDMRACVFMCVVFVCMKREKRRKEKRKKKNKVSNTQYAITFI